VVWVTWRLVIIVWMIWIMADEWTSQRRWEDGKNDRE
jgi:hypothetical protein